MLEPNERGSSGYGKTFLALDNGRLREDSVRDMGTAIDWIATQARLDAWSVLVVGGSYGGYRARAASVRLADRIAGAVSVVGISHFVSFLVQGRNDPRVPWTESERIVRRPQTRGTPVGYLLAYDEGHGFARRENADFHLAALAAFIEQTLLR